MNVIILIDADNFRNGLENVSKSRKQFRNINYYKINQFVIDYLRNNEQYKEAKLTHLRTYLYTGVYTDKLLNKVEHAIKKEKGKRKKKKLQDLTTVIQKGMEGQKEFLKEAKDYYFFEIRLKPLQLNHHTYNVYQKGVDVQMAVDLVEFAYRDVFDVAVLLSGDVDLLESISTVKNLGKQVIVFGDDRVTSEEIKRESDFFIDLRSFSNKQLDQFSRR